jgi:putative copper resistance protein D
VPRIVVLSWALALAGLAVLGVAVAGYLSDSSAHAPAMVGMSMSHSVGDAIYRGGSADPTRPLLGSALLTAWQLDAAAVAVLVLGAATYLTGVALVAVRTGQRWSRWRTTSFLAGLGAVGYASCGSFGVYDQALFSAHMAGHLVFVMLAPALLVAGRPLRLAISAARPDRAERLRRIATGRVLSVLTAPPVALACYAAVIVGTHLTGLMDSIMRTTWAGQLEHLGYLAVGVQFFVLILGDEPIRWQLAYPARWLLLALGMAVDTFTGIVLLQGTRVVHMTPLPALHVDALSDTHTGGAVMWFGGDAIMAAVMVVLVLVWLRTADSPAPAQPGWLEQARRAAFADNAGTAGTTDTHTDIDIDSDDAAREAYNAWLSQL